MDTLLGEVTLSILFCLPSVKDYSKGKWFAPKTLFPFRVDLLLEGGYTEKQTGSHKIRTLLEGKCHTCGGFTYMPLIAEYLTYDKKINIAKLIVCADRALTRQSNINMQGWVGIPIKLIKYTYNTRESKCV